MKVSTLRILVVSLLLAGCGTEDPAPGASVSGSARELTFGPSANAMAGTFWGADDGLNVVITDARDPCGAWTERRREPNTSTLVLQFGDYADGFTETATRAGDYTFVDEPAFGQFFRVLRAFHLDNTCMPTVPDGVDANSGSGTLDETVAIPGGRAVGSFAADFAAGSIHGTFSAAFCEGPMGPPTPCEGAPVGAPSVDGKPFEPGDTFCLCE